SSSNSRFAAFSGSSSSSNSPFGIVHAPSSFFCQKGPPGWTNSTSRPPEFSRYNKRPALFFFAIYLPWFSRVRAKSRDLNGPTDEQLSFKYIYKVMVFCKFKLEVQKAILCRFAPEGRDVYSLGALPLL